jgi:hydrogenase/urease accessory protein HupE
MPVEAKARMAESYLDIDLTFTNITTQKLKVRSNILRRFLPEHQEMVNILDENQKEIFARTLTASANEFEMTRTNQTTITASTPAPAASQTFFALLKQGILHIITGYDHLLFLFGLLVMCENFLSVAKIITCFTIAHSLTLGLAAFGVVPVNSRIVEPMIAATIVYVGVENLLRLKTIQWRWVLTFVFGLIHGFGFASGLQELGISSSNIVLPVLSFNLGVEVGQVCIAGLVLPIMWRLRKVPQLAPHWVTACSVVVVALGSYWFIGRVWGF